MNTRLTITSIILGLLVAFAASPVSAGTYSGGTGESNNPFLISTPADMQEIASRGNWPDWDKHFLLTTDIDLSDYTGTSFNIIGNSSRAFSGVFDGNDHCISNFTWSASGAEFYDSMGLFGVTDPNAVIKNVHLKGAKVALTASQTISAVGLLVGLNRGSITDCSVQGIIQASVYDDTVTKLGGLVGYCDGGTIARCSSNCGIFASVFFYTSPSPSDGCRHLGGLVGYQSLGLIEDCFATGGIFGSAGVGKIFPPRLDKFGGLAGGAWNSTIRNCYAAAVVTASTSGDIYYLGGLIGEGYSTSVTSSFWDVQVSGQSASQGGTGKSTAQMQTEATFEDAGWDFDNTWAITQGKTYPQLRPYLVADLNGDGIVDFGDFLIMGDEWMQTIE